jgi:hypothetical protein
MTVITGSKGATLHAGPVLSPDQHPHPYLRGALTEGLRAVALTAGLVLAGAGLVLGIAVVWTQLARALPLAALLHHARVGRAAVLLGAGVGFLLLGRRGRHDDDRG